jgi:Fic family protein
MDKSAFTKPNGKFIHSKENHETFLPNPLPPTTNFDSITITLATEAHTKLGQLSGIGELIPNPDLLIRPYIRREAAFSSKIEGTQATMMDIFEYEAEGKNDSQEVADRKQIREVLNYIKSLNVCLKKVETESISISMIKEAHDILMKNVRGQEKTPGEFRKIQNWIGKEGSQIEDAVYVPPAPEMLDGVLTDFESFIQSPPFGIPVLIQCALIHYQFESIHPFADGNGRIGRLLIPLILAERKLLSRPLLYLSVYFEKNRSEYYRHLLSVSQNQTWTEWIQFFLRGVIIQASDAITNIRRLTDLRTTYEEKLRTKKASGNATQLMAYLFANPVVTIPGAEKYLGVTYPSAKLAIERLQEIGILEEIGNRERNKMFKATEILNILT